MTATYHSSRNPAAQRELLNPAARLGLTARAFMYLLVGVLALMVATGHSTAETDQLGAMQQLNRIAVGHVLLWVVAVGLGGYALWRFSEAVFGAAGEGKKLAPRLKSFGQGCVYAGIAVGAFGVALGSGTRSQAARQESLSAKVMHHAGGRLALGLAGVVIVIVGLALVREGLTVKFDKYLDLSSVSRRGRRLIETLGVIGTVARGVVFGLAGVLVIQAAWDYQPKKAAGLDGALRSLRDTGLGPWLLGVVAAGLVAFGLYGLAEARWRRT